MGGGVEHVRALVVHTLTAENDSNRHEVSKG